MKKHFNKNLVRTLTTLLGCALLIGSTLNLTGCAEAEFEADSPLNPQYENDPVARAAFSQRRIRQPASSNENYAPDNSNSFATGLLNFLGLIDSSKGSSAAQEATTAGLTLGMSMPKVKRLWGQPQDVEVAGDPNSGNERWTYLNGLSSRWGTSSYRVVYFEQGQVAGWESKR